MELRDYARIVSRITLHEADDVDDLLRTDARRAQRPGAAIFPACEAPLMPQVAFRRADAVCVGVRVAPGGGPAADRAMRFAAMAMERDIEVIILAEEDLCGFERFGFRTERIAGEGEARDNCVDQLRRFWALDLVLEA